MDHSGGLYDFETWAPLLEYLREEEKQGHWDSGPGGLLEGEIDQHGYSMPRLRHRQNPGRAAVEAQWAVIRRVADALAEAGSSCVSFSTQIAPVAPAFGQRVTLGMATLRLRAFSPAEQRYSGYNYEYFPRVVILVDGAVPEPWRHEPDPVPGARPAPTADPGLVERTMREWFPAATGATEEEVAACERRLGVPLPDELKALYRVASGRPDDWGTFDDGVRLWESLPNEFLFTLDSLYVADPATRGFGNWDLQAQEAVITPPGARVQGLVGSPGWIVFAHDGSGEMTAVDLTPGPAGHVGQVIEIPHERDLGARLVCDSVTDLILHRQPEQQDEPPAPASPAVTEVRDGNPGHGGHAVPTVQAAADPALEVLTIFGGGDAPHSLVPLAGLPRLRTLVAGPGALADPREIAGLTGLEFLELGPDDWRSLLNADAVPRSLLAAAVHTRGQDQSAADAVVTDLLALFDRPQATETVLEGMVTI
jgi:cell wall assembly regulator SMI1